MTDKNDTIIHTLMWGCFHGLTLFLFKTIWDIKTYRQNIENLDRNIKLYKSTYGTKKQ
jgi:hypothetical protein